MSGLYTTHRWRQARKRFLAAHPTCILCSQLGVVTAADTVDHKLPHKGDQALFWAERNWQPVCKRCHDSRKAMLERGDKVQPHESWTA